MPTKPIKPRRLNALEEFRQEIFTMLSAAAMAEREACAKIAEEHRGYGSTGKRAGQLIAEKIRGRPAFKAPPLAFETIRRRDRW